MKFVVKNKWFMFLCNSNHFTFIWVESKNTVRKIGIPLHNPILLYVKVGYERGIYMYFTDMFSTSGGKVTRSCKHE